MHRATRAAGWVTALVVVLLSVAGPAQGASTPYPAPIGAAFVTGSAVVGQTLTCHPGVWTGAPTAFTYSWTESGSTVVTGQTYVVTPGDIGHDPVCVVVATNASGSATSGTGGQYLRVRSATGGPVARSNPFLAGTLAAGSTLTCEAPYYATPPDAITYSFDSPTGGQSASASSSYVVQSGDEMGPVTCTATASTTGGTSTETSDALPSGGADDDWDPIGESGSIAVVGTGLVGQPLTCVISGLLAGVTTSIRWESSNIPNGDTTTTYAPVATDQEHGVECYVDIRDGVGHDTWYTTDPTPITAAPGAPAGGPAPTVTGSGTVGSNLSCSPGAWAGASSYRYAWSTDLPSSSGTSNPYISATSTYPVRQPAEGRIVRCGVVAVSAAGESALVWSAPWTVPVDPAAPVVTAAPSIGGTAAVGKVITCDPGTWTGATDLAFRWIDATAGYELTSGATSADGGDTWTVTFSSIGHQILCEVEGVDVDTTFITPSPSVTPVAAAPQPVALMLPTVTGSGVVGEPLTCTRGSFSQPFAPEHEHVSFTVGSFFNSPGELGYDIYRPTAAEVGQVAYCGIDIDNANGYATAVSAVGVLIRASGTPAPAPTHVPAPALTPGPIAPTPAPTPPAGIAPPAVRAPVPAPLRLTARAPSAQLRWLTTGAATVRVTCSVACRIHSVLTLTHAQATALGMSVAGRGPAPVGHLDFAHAAGTFTILLPLDQRLSALLTRSHPRLRLLDTIRATSASGGSTVRLATTIPAWLRPTRR